MFFLSRCTTYCTTYSYAPLTMHPAPFTHSDKQTPFTFVFTVVHLIHQTNHLTYVTVRIALLLWLYLTVTAGPNRDWELAISVPGDTPLFSFFSFFRFLLVMKSLPSYIFGESSHFPWCIPPTLPFSQCNSLSCKRTAKKKTNHMGPSHPSLHLATQKWTGPAFSAPPPLPHCGGCPPSCEPAVICWIFP